jgi:hypothetical protein
LQKGLSASAVLRVLRVMKALIKSLNCKYLICLKEKYPLFNTITNVGVVNKCAAFRGG